MGVIMAIPESVRRQMQKNGLTEVNQPKRTPRHPTKSHVVMASQGGKYKLVRFGQQGAKPVQGTPRNDSDRQRQQSFRARFRKQYEKFKNDKFSAIYWAWRLW